MYMFNIIINRGHVGVHGSLINIALLLFGSAKSHIRYPKTVSNNSN